MPRKKTRPTLEQHVEIGQAIKDCNKAITNMIRLIQPFLTKSEYEKLYNIRDHTLCVLQSQMEDVMFQDFPYLTHEAISVYYHEDEHVDADELMRLAREGGMVDRNAPGSMPRKMWDEMMKAKVKRNERS